MNEPNQPLYMKLYNSLYEDIMEERYKDGDRLPTEIELADKFSVSRITSRKALDILVENGYIKRIPGRGSFVTLNNKQEEQPKDEQLKLEQSNEGSVKNEAKKMIIGFIIPDFSASYGMDLLSGIEREACNNNCIFTFYRTYGRQDLEEKAIDFLTDMGADGIIIMPVHGEHYNHKILKMVLDGYPFVLVDRYLKGILAPFVGSDNVAASKKMTDYILELGHRNISFISPPVQDTSTIEDRIEGFVKSHAERGVAVNEALWMMDFISTIPGKSTEENIQMGLETLKKFIQGNPEITCFFVVEYNLALMVLEAVKSLGKSVPEDYSIVCFDGPVNYVGNYFFTHVRQMEVEMGTKAVKMLLEQIGKKDCNEKLLLGSDIIIGDSTRHI